MNTKMDTATEMAKTDNRIADLMGLVWEELGCRQRIRLIEDRLRDIRSDLVNVVYDNFAAYYNAFQPIVERARKAGYTDVSDLHDTITSLDGVPDSITSHNRPLYGKGGLRLFNFQDDVLHFESTNVFDADAPDILAHIPVRYLGENGLELITVDAANLTRIMDELDTQRVAGYPDKKSKNGPRT